MKTSYLLSQLSRVIIIALLFGGLSPALANASSSHSSNSTSVTPSAQIDQSSLSTATGKKAYITGTASSTSSVMFTITATSSNKILYKSSTTRVSNGQWGRSVSKKLKDGSYDVTVYAIKSSKKTLVATGTLTVGVQPGQLSVASIALLTGGTTRAGSTIPVSYLQIRNTSTATTTINGFWLTQDGSAPENTIIGASSVDGSGGSRASVGGTEGSSLFSNGKLYVPSAGVLAPGERKLFTLKVQLSSNVRAPGQALMLNVTGVDVQSQFTNTFPITGTTWVLQ